MAYNPDVFCVGYRRGVHVHLAANDKGIAQLPDLIWKSDRPNWNSRMYDVNIAATVPNVMGLLMLELITHNDATNILEGAMK